MMWLYLGAQGAGKTLNMVLDAYVAYNAAKKLGVTLPIYTNFPLNPKYLPHKRISTISELFGCRSGLLLLDEVQSTLDSRLYASTTNILVSSRLLLYMRKRDLMVRATAQFEHLVEKRFRDNCHHFCYCFPHPEGFAGLWYDNQLGRMGNKRIIPRDKWIFSLYDTMQQADILSLDMDNLEKLFPDLKKNSKVGAR